MNLTRREFVKGSFAPPGFLALPGGLFAAPAGWKPKGYNTFAKDAKGGL